MIHEIHIAQKNLGPRLPRGGVAGRVPELALGGARPV